MNDYEIKKQPLTTLEAPPGGRSGDGSGGGGIPYPPGLGK